MKTIVISLFFLISNTVFAAANIYQFETAEQEKRFQNLIFILRCPTCQNQNLADSNSMVAEDLKQIVYEKIVAGESDKVILDFMKQRYGAFILYEPEVSASNLFLWLGPFLFLVFALVGFLLWYKKNKKELPDD